MEENFNLNCCNKSVPGISADYSKRFKDEVGLPVITNGGFQEMALIEETLQKGKADFVAKNKDFVF